MKRVIFALGVILLFATCKKEIPQKQLTVNVTPDVGGTVSPSTGTYAMGSTVKVLATPSAEYVFKEWTGGFIGTTNPGNVIMDVDKTVIAVFEKREYPLSLTIVGSGTVKEEIIKNAAASTNYKSGTSVRLTPQPSEGYEFKGWSGDDTSSKSPLDLIVSKAINLTCTFDKEEAIKFSTNLDTGTYNVVDTLPLVITVSSKLPKAGILYSIEITKLDSNIKVYRLDSTTTRSALSLKISGFKYPGTYSTKITITSKSSTSNFANKTIPIIKNQYQEEYSKINQTTGWYNTNKLFGGRNFFIDSNTTYNKLWTKDNVLGYTYSATGTDYFSNRQGLFYGDLNGDGKKDIFNNYWPNPFGANANGYYATFEYDLYWFNKPNLFKGLTGARKFIFNDYYGNGKKSMLICSSGADAPPFPGDSVQILSFGSDLSMTAKNISEVLGYFHGGASGDIDNDGDIDILLYSGGGAKPMGPVYYENLGSGNFKYNANLITGLGYANNNSNNYYTVELFDVNNDGYLDILLASGNGDLISRILWGSATHTFNTSNQTILPDASYAKQSIVDIAFSDIDKDGDIDLLLNHAISYTGFGIQILENQNNKFVDVTSKRVDVATNPLSVWFGWLRLYDVDYDGDLDLVADGIAYIQNQQQPNAQPIPNITWINDGKGNYKASIFF